MSAKGLKRPLEPDSEPDVQPVSNRDDDLSSPECLLSLQPVKDDYSSDEARKKTETSKKRPRKSVVLSPHSYSRKFSGPEVLFFFDLLFTPQPPPVDMPEFPVVSVSEQILKFLYNDTDGDEDGDHEFTKDGRNVTEIYCYYLKKFKWLSWMKDNDNLNLKTCTKDDISKKESCIMKDAADLQLDNKNVQFFELKDLRNITELMWHLHNEYKGNQCKNHDTWKHVFTLLHKILESDNCPQSESFTSLRYNGQAVYKFDYKVPPHLVSEGNSSKIAATSCINIYPDSIYDTTYIQHNNRERVGKIVIEVYGPKSGSLSSEDELKMHQKEESKKKNMGSAFLEKPEREIDAICSQSYKSKALAYLQQSLPYDCQDSHTAKQLTGQHAMQLIGMAEEHSRQLMKMNMKTNAHMNKANPVYKAIGMFLKNEYIVFSKLEINYERMQSYWKPGSYENAKLEEGKISFSHWRLDVMKPNHRLALIVALLEILKPDEDQ